MPGPRTSTLSETKVLDVNAILYKIYPSMINFILLSYQLRIWIGTLRAQTLHIEIKINRNYSNLKLYIVTSRAFFYSARWADWQTLANAERPKLTVCLSGEYL